MGHGLRTEIKRKDQSRLSFNSFIQCYHIAYVGPDFDNQKRQVFREKVIPAGK